MNATPAVKDVRAWLLGLQQRITSACTEADGKAGPSNAEAKEAE
ncbi:MAG: coproporphyrinogen III oxidase, partial [Pseudomonadota bacterium]